VDAETFVALLEPMIETLQTIHNPSKPLGTMIIAYAVQHIAKHSVEVGGQNRGPWLWLYVQGHEGTDWPWCAGFVTFLLRQACDTLGRAMPIEGSF